MLFVFLTRRVGAVRRAIATERQSTMADVSSLVEESLSVSGVLLGKTMGRAPDLAQRFSRDYFEARARGGSYPQVDFSATASRLKTSLLPEGIDQLGPVTNNFTLGPGVTYALDVFGGECQFLV